MKILTSRQIARVEEKCAEIGLPSPVLMENAGKAVADEVRHSLGNTARKPILILIGPGNNGGDGLVAARHLHDWGASVSLYLSTKRPENDPNLALVKERAVPCVEASQDESLNRLAQLLAGAEVVIDALFGTGKLRPLGGHIAETLKKVSESQRTRPELKIFALDLPSGLDADSGAVDAACLHADVTITLGFPKIGLFRFPGATRVGRLVIADIGMPAHLADETAPELITPRWAASILPRRPPEANKGTFGRVLVAAGSQHYIGAAYLACNGAARAGAGLVTLATAASLQPILAAKLTETTYLPLPEASPGKLLARAAGIVSRELANYQALLLGCGLGQSPATVRFIRNLLLGGRANHPPLVLDADALNTLAQTGHWWQQLDDDTILTPHPGEMARLASTSTDEVQRERIELARSKATEWHKTIVLKGAFTVIAAPNGRCFLNPSANPGLASAGTGDVLSGVIAGLVAQGLPLFEAAALGVFLHGEAGEIVRAKMGDTGLLASDLLPEIPRVIKKLKHLPLTNATIRTEGSIHVNDG